MERRWKLLVGSLGFAVLGLSIIWGSGHWQHQSLKLIATFAVVCLSACLSLVWFLFFSGFGKKTKVLGTLFLVVVGLFLSQTLEVREVSGDVMPILAWTWTPRAHERLDNREVDGSSVPLVPSKDANVAYPRFLGQDSLGTVTGINLITDWETNPPSTRWRIPVGAAWSGFAVRDGLAITQEQRGEMEMVTCYSLATGELIWSHGDEQLFSTTVGGDGPRATPTISGDQVYTFGALGLLNCLDLRTGQLLWQREVAKEHQAEKPRWGYSCSPLIFSHAEEERVVVSPGGPNGHSLVAYRAHDGEPIWAAGDAPPGYSSPQLASLAGSDMILIFNNGSVAGHDPVGGELLWEMPWSGGKPCVANPRVLPGDRVLVSAGYGMGSKLYQISRNGDGFTADIIYETPRLKAKFANFVIHGDHAYGLDDGVLVCMDLASGERVWKKGRYGHGQLLLVDDLLLVQSEDGELHLLRAQPSGHELLGSFPVLSGKSWNTMALAGQLLLMRNHKEAVCLVLGVETRRL